MGAKLGWRCIRDHYIGGSTL